ncbi:TPA: hypothetical protein NJ353_004107 [Vibrio parahaemolyticus]|nr:hypothetical protein [Vibrio parahaemolyticus]HCG7083623.1 hypothetical protein [Vibrio parahaemolyticus]HCH0725469.1 hypothetical protein [Vibrio parahaemolyticus]HCH1053915.1 hypothetical protein [Vibrio parahaemolyticus]HCM0781964.1 hypothetical protein [Vibrio parahaemolyticus]
METLPQFSFKHSQYASRISFVISLDVAIIEIRPKSEMKGLSGVVDFSGNSIKQLMVLGDEDGMRVLTKHIDAINRVVEQNSERMQRNDAVNNHSK